MKKLLSTIMIATVLGSASYAPKSEAGIALVIAGGETMARYDDGHPNALLSNRAGYAMVATGIVVYSSAIFAIASSNMPLLAFLMVLSEDGSLPQEQLESTLTEKYDFIADREVVSTLAQKIAEKSLTIEADAQGVKMVSLTEDEVKSILAPAELTQEEVAVVAQDLK